jgi:hypothetical protein
MIQFVLDTDHFTLHEHANSAVGKKVSLQTAGSVGLCVVTVEEAPKGRLGVLNNARTGADRIARYRLFENTVELLHDT